MAAVASEKARAFALPAIDRALAGAPARPRCTPASATRTSSTTGPTGYPFLAELADCAADVLAVEAAQQRLDPAVFEPIAAKTVIVGVLDLDDDAGVETPEVVARRIEAALKVIPEERLQVGPDCGMKYLPREVAYAKLRALVAGARLVSGWRAPSASRPTVTRAGGRRILGSS